jgi:hypothetical protein
MDSGSIYGESGKDNWQMTDNYQLLLAVMALTGTVVL